jgi:probable F420-dependent oxidoreductase
MKIGLAFHATDLAMDVAELAREAEDRGFYALYVPEHTHIPTSRRTPPATGESELAEEYYRSPDPVVALAAAAAVTERILLGTGIALPMEHDPISYAKQIATLDRISGGRFVFGIGYGWNLEEMENHGVDPKRRRAHVRETVLAMQALWSEERAAFAGEFIRFEESFQWPKPIQQPRPRTLMGGAAGPTLFRHIAEYCDGWMPIGGAGMSAALDQLRAACDEAGRDYGALHLAPFGVYPEAGKMDYYRKLGLSECALRIPSAGRDEVLPALDAYGEWIEAMA